MLIDMVVSFNMTVLQILIIVQQDFKTRCILTDNVMKIQLSFLFLLWSVLVEDRPNDSFIFCNA